MKRLDIAAKAADTVLNALLALAFALIMLSGAYAFADSAWQFRGAQDKSLLAFRPQLTEKVEGSRQISENQVGWISVPGTGLDFPLLQGKDNSEYLNKDPYGEFSYSGSIFLDCRCSPDLTDTLSTVYGHHMSGGNMFGCLDAFKDAGYLAAHAGGTLHSRSEAFDLELLGAFECLATEGRIFDPGRFPEEELRRYIRESCGLPELPGGRLIALTTCLGDGDGRLVVVGRITPKEEVD